MPRASGGGASTRRQLPAWLAIEVINLLHFPEQRPDLPQEWLLVPLLGQGLGELGAGWAVLEGGKGGGRMGETRKLRRHQCRWLVKSQGGAAKTMSAEIEQVVGLFIGRQKLTWQPAQAWRALRRSRTQHVQRMPS